MTEFLVKRFVQNYVQTERPEVRTSYGLLAGVVGICCNLLLFAVKIAVGILTGSISVMADAFNNLSDAASSIVGFVGVKMAQKPADEHHPFGHGRIEYIAAFIVAFIVIEVGFSLLKTSVGKLLHPEKLTFGLFSLVILVLSVAVKLWMALFNRKLGQRIHSKVLTATSADSLGDAAATSATILSMAVFGIWHVNIDGLVGVVVSVLVIIAGFNIAKDTLEPLIGEPIDPEVYQQITDFVNQYEGIMGSHDLIVHNYGPGRSMASIHAEVPSDVDIEVSHEVVDRIEREAAKKLGIFLVIHMDPVVVKDMHVNSLRQMTEGLLKSVDERLTMHDFRITEGERSINLIFDLVVPRDYTVSMQEASKQEICRRLKEQDDRYCGMITVECTYCMER